MKAPPKIIFLLEPDSQAPKADRLPSLEVKRLQCPAILQMTKLVKHVADHLNLIPVRTGRICHRGLSVHYPVLSLNLFR